MFDSRQGCSKLNFRYFPNSDMSRAIGGKREREKHYSYCVACTVSGWRRRSHAARSVSFRVPSFYRPVPAHVSHSTRQELNRSHHQHQYGTHLLCPANENLSDGFLHVTRSPLSRIFQPFRCCHALPAGPPNRRCASPSPETTPPATSPDGSFGEKQPPGSGVAPGTSLLGPAPVPPAISS